MINFLFSPATFSELCMCSYRCFFPYMVIVGVYLQSESPRVRKKNGSCAIDYKFEIEIKQSCRCYRANHDKEKNLKIYANSLESSWRHVHSCVVQASSRILFVYHTVKRLPLQSLSTHHDVRQRWEMCCVPASLGAVRCVPRSPSSRACALQPLRQLISPEEQHQCRRPGALPPFPHGWPPHVTSSRKDAVPSFPEHDKEKNLTCTHF